MNHHLHRYDLREIGCNPRYCLTCMRWIARPLESEVERDPRGELFAEYDKMYAKWAEARDDYELDAACTELFRRTLAAFGGSRIYSRRD